MRRIGNIATVDKRFEHYAQPAAIAFLVVACFLVLKPFLAAILFAAVVCVTTRPIYLWLLHKLNDKKNLAALIMTLSLALLAILPITLVAYSLADYVTALYDNLHQAVTVGTLEPPAWLAKLPLAGKSLEAYWRHVASSREEVIALTHQLLGPTKDFIFSGGMIVMEGFLDMGMAALISFFFYRDGEELMLIIRLAMDRVIGAQTANVLDIINNTVRNVMYGELGTAIAQGVVATIGFYIASVPAALLLGVATFLLSLIPIGPPLIWGGVSAWLFYHSSAGWGVFMLLWGFFLISTVDNLVRPYLISLGSSLPFLLVLLGVLGGMTVFGLIGIFIGPTLLAVGYSLAHKWVNRELDSTES